MLNAKEIIEDINDDTSDLIECFGSLMTTDKYIEFGWLDYDESN